ncbi:MAG: DVU0298 family protein [Chloroflexota bacterium]
MGFDQTPDHTLAGERLPARLRRYLLAYQLDAITALAGEKRRVLSFLTALTYDLDRLVSWRAVEAIGLAAARIAQDDPEYVRNHLRRQVWLLSDESGGIGWRAPEIIGAILCPHPGQFARQYAEFIPLLISILDLESEDVVRFQAGVLWAIGRLAQALPYAELRMAVPLILPCLQDQRAQVRGMALWCLQQPGFRAQQQVQGAVQPLLRSFRDDSGVVEFYEGGQLILVNLSQLCVTFDR